MTSPNCPVTAARTSVRATLGHGLSVPRRARVLPHVHPYGRRPHAPDEGEEQEDVQQSAHAVLRRARRPEEKERGDATARRVLQHGQQREAADGHDDDQWHEIHGVHIDDVHLLQATQSSLTYAHA